MLDILKIYRRFYEYNRVQGEVEKRKRILTL